MKTLMWLINILLVVLGAISLILLLFNDSTSKLMFIVYVVIWIYVIGNVVALDE